MPNANEFPLTSAEIGNLWTLYMADMMIICVKKYLLAKSQDEQIREVLQEAITISEQRCRNVAAIFKSSNVPVPIAYDSKDVNSEAPRLYSDTLALYHALARSRWALTMYSTALYLSVRPDVRKLFQDAISSSTKLNEHGTQVALKKGLLIRSPIVSISQTPHIVEKPSYIGSIIGEHRPLHVVSVAHIFLSLVDNIIGKATIMGFAQVARDPEIRQYFLRGAKICAKQIEILGSLLSDEEIPISSSPDSMLTSSTVPPFSDKLMLDHIILVNSIGIADMGLAAGQSNRADIAAAYLRLGAEVIQFGEDGVNIAIKNGWLEAPPQVVSHRELVLSGSKR